MIFNENGQMSRGFELLLTQLLKMLKLDPELILGQIRGIHELMLRHVAQQDEIINRLERLENGKPVSTENAERQSTAAATGNS